LTVDELEALDAAAAKIDMSRSEAIRAAPAHFAACRFTRARSSTAVGAHRRRTTRRARRRWPAPPPALAAATGSYPAPNEERRSLPRRALDEGRLSARLVDRRCVKGRHIARGDELDIPFLRRRRGTSVPMDGCVLARCVLVSASEGQMQTLTKES
jgi:hypothetical protein